MGMNPVFVLHRTRRSLNSSVTCPILGLPVRSNAGKSCWLFSICHRLDANRDLVERETALIADVVTLNLALPVVLVLHCLSPRGARGRLQLSPSVPALMIPLTKHCSKGACAQGVVPPTQTRGVTWNTGKPDIGRSVATDSGWTWMCHATVRTLSDSQARNYQIFRCIGILIGTSAHKWEWGMGGGSLSLVFK